MIVLPEVNFPELISGLFLTVEMQAVPSTRGSCEGVLTGRGLSGCHKLYHFPGVHLQLDLGWDKGDHTVSREKQHGEFLFTRGIVQLADSEYILVNFIFFILSNHSIMIVFVINCQYPQSLQVK